MQRERKRRFGVNAIISLIEAGLCACIYVDDDDGVDAETSLSLSLHFYLSSPPLHFFLALTIGNYILFENACELQRVVLLLEEPSQRQRRDALSLVYQIYHKNNKNNNITLGWKNPAKDKGAMPCPLHLAKGKGATPFLGLSCLGERTQLKTKVRCLVFCIMPKAKARCLSLVKSRQITRLPRGPCFLAGGRSQCKGKGAMPFLGLSCLGDRTQLKTKARYLVFCIMPQAKAQCLSLVKSRQITRLTRVPCFLAGRRPEPVPLAWGLVRHSRRIATPEGPCWQRSTSVSALGEWLSTLTCSYTYVTTRRLSYVASSYTYRFQEPSWQSISKWESAKKNYASRFSANHANERKKADEDCCARCLYTKKKSTLNHSIFPVWERIFRPNTLYHGAGASEV